MQRQYHLRHSADFETARARGKQLHHPFVTMTIAPNDLPYNRFGFVASRRLGNAVVRNRVRRLLREVVRHSIPHLLPGHDIIFVARNASVDQPYNKIHDTLSELFRKARLFQRNPRQAAENEQ